VGGSVSAANAAPITYGIALGTHRGQKAFTLQTLSPRGEDRGGERVAQANGFSLHAGVTTEAGERGKLEPLYRYVSRPAVAIERLSLTAQGHVRYALKSPYRDGTTHVVFEPLDFLSRLAALVPSPRVNLRRFHGVFAPHHRLRARIAPGQGARGQARAGSGPSRLGAATEAGLLDRGRAVRAVWGRMRIIACIEDPDLIEKILRHLGLGATSACEPMPRAPPSGAGLFD
jgi:hypothetical protein